MQKKQQQEETGLVTVFEQLEALHDRLMQCPSTVYDFTEEITAIRRLLERTDVPRLGLEVALVRYYRLLRRIRERLVSETEPRDRQSLFVVTQHTTA
jgi:hypothetical protein